MKLLKFIIFLATCAVCINAHIASAQEWQWRDPLDFEHIVGIKQFQNILIPIGFLGSLLLTDSKHDSNQGFGTIRPGSWFIHSRAAYYRGYKSAQVKTSKTKVVEWSIGFGHYFRKWLAAGIDFYATGFVGSIRFRGGTSSEPVDIDQDIRTAAVGGGPFVRWHLVSYLRWSVYFEQGLSIIFIKSEFPPRGTKTNFTPTYGLGMSFKLFQHIYFMVSVRHYHLSNNDIDGARRNPGFDANGFYIGSHFQF